MEKPVRSRRSPATVSAPHRSVEPGSQVASPIAMSAPSCEREGITMAPRLRPLPFSSCVLLLAACAPAPASSSARRRRVADRPAPSAAPSPPTAYPVTLTDDAGREVTLDAEPDAHRQPGAVEHRDRVRPRRVRRAGRRDRLRRLPRPGRRRRRGRDMAQVDVEKVVAAEPDLDPGRRQRADADSRHRPAHRPRLPVLALYPEIARRDLRATSRSSGRRSTRRRGAPTLVADMESRVDDGRGRGRRRRAAADLLRGRRLRGHDLHRRRGLVPGRPDRDRRRRADHRRRALDRHPARGPGRRRSGADPAGRRRVRPTHHAPRAVAARPGWET